MDILGCQMTDLIVPVAVRGSGRARKAVGDTPAASGRDDAGGGHAASLCPFACVREP
jgi:hypothetical protein